MSKNKSNFALVREFHEAFGLDVRSQPNWPPAETIKLRLSLIEEELAELKEAVNEKDVVGVADALTDLAYVVYGAALCWGVNLDATFKEVHRSNMSKLGEDGRPIYRVDGKVMKGPNFSEPDLKQVLDNQ